MLDFILIAKPIIFIKSSSDSAFSTNPFFIIDHLYLHGIVAYYDYDVYVFFYIRLIYYLCLNEIDFSFHKMKNDLRIKIEKRIIENC